jgi:hypothetical protein
MAVTSTAITGATMTSPSSSRDDGALHVTITSDGHIEWRGSRAILEASGLIPPNFNWPRRIDYAHWHTGGFDFMLRRCRPDGLMGPMRRWMKHDYWFVCRSPSSHPRDTRLIHVLYPALGEFLFRAARSREALRIDMAEVREGERIGRVGEHCFA